MWRSACLLAIFAVACRGPNVVAPDIDAEDNDLIVAVVVGNDGSIQTMDVVDASSQPLGLPAAEGAELFTFVVAQSDLIGVDGHPASTDGIMLVATDRASSIGCGICGSPASHAPQVVRSGDVCPIPPFAKAQRWRVEDGRLAVRPAEATDTTSVRGALQMVWPGVCSCAALPMISPAAPSLTLLTGDDGRPADAVAESPEGTIAIFGEQFAAALQSDGTRTTITEVPWAGLVTSAVGQSGGRFVLWTSGRASRAYLIQPDLEVAALTTDDALLSHRAVRPNNSDSIVIAGRRAQQPALHTCALDLSRPSIDCEPLVLDVTFGTRFSDAAVLDSGLFVGITNTGAPTFFERFVPLDDYRGFAGDRLTTANGDVRLVSAPPIGDERLTNVHAIGGRGRRVFVCASVEVGEVVLTASVSATVFGTDGSLPWREVHRSTSLGPCTALQATTNGTVRAHFTGGVVEFDDAGDVVRELVDDPIARPVRARRSLSNDTLLFEGVDGSVFVRRPDGAIERAHGTEDYRPGWAGAIAVRGEEHWVFGAHGARFEGVREVEVVEGVAADRVPTSAAYDPINDIFFVGGHCVEDCPPWLSTVTASASWTSIAVPNDLGPLVQIAILETRTVVAFSEGIVVIDNDVSTTAVVDWGPRGRPTSCGRDIIRGIAASHGVAWAVGCEGLVLRVVPSSDRPHAERVEVLPEDQRHPLHAVSARCADDIVVAARGTGFSVAEEEGFVWRWTSRSSAIYDQNVGSAVSGRASNDPIALLSSDRLVDIVFSSDTQGAVHRFGTDRRLFFSAPFRSAAVTPSGRTVIGASNERLLLLE